jgi:hypothetical protein
VAKLVTQPFCKASSSAPARESQLHRRSKLGNRLVSQRELLELTATGTTYVALQGALQDQLLSHLCGPSWDSRSVEVVSFFAVPRFVGVNRNRGLHELWNSEIFVRRK